MPATAFNDLSRLCIHSITNKPWRIDQIARHYSAAGVAAVSVWRETIANENKTDVGRRLRDNGLRIVSYVRGGFFAACDRSRQIAAIDDNRTVIDEAEALGAPLVVLVCGADPGQSLETSRQQIYDGIAALVPHAQAAGVKLGIEPLHPMYANDRSAINTLQQANDLVDALQSDLVGIVYDVYHLWWDPDLPRQTARCGARNKLWAFHICDWKTPTTDMLLDRGLMGEGCIDLRNLRGQVEAAGFKGFCEVEIFSKKYWAMPQEDFLKLIVKAYLDCA
jgi:sugar phosphate isomerase/epimerase